MLTLAAVLSWMGFFGEGGGCALASMADFGWIEEIGLSNDRTTQTDAPAAAARIFSP